MKRTYTLKRKRRLLDAVKMLSQIQNEEEQLEKEEGNKLYSLSIVFTTALILLNIFVFMDVFMLPTVTVPDTVSSASVVGSNKSDPAYKMITATGHSFRYNPTGAEQPGNALEVIKSSVFGIPKAVFDKSSNQMVDRQFDDFTFSKYWSVIAIVLGTIGLLFRRAILDHYLAVMFASGMVVGQLGYMFWPF